MKKLILSLALLGCLSGCILTPSFLRGGDPTKRVERAKERQDEAQLDMLRHAQKFAYQLKSVLAEPQSDRRDEIAREYAADTVAALDQSIGAPKADDAVAWKKQAVDLLSENIQIRRAAQKQHDRDMEDLSVVSEKLSKATDRVEKAEAKAVQYAKECDGLMSYIRIACWAAAFWGLAQLLVLLAKLNPAFNTAASVASALLHPASFLKKA